MGDLESKINKKMIAGMENYGKEGYEGVTATWDLVQEELHCCGVNNAKEWNTTNHGQTPDSCCMTFTNGCGKTATTEQLWSMGCLTEMKKEFLANIDKIGGTAIGIAVIQLIGVIIACCIGKRMKDSGESV